MRFTVIVVIFALLSVHAATVPNNSPLTINLGPKTINAPIQGRDFPIVVKATARPSLTPEGVSILLNSEVDISSLRPFIVEAIRGAGNANDDCGNKSNLHTIFVEPSGNGLAIRISGHFERWACGYITHPVFDGWNGILPKFRMVTERFHQNKLFEQNGTIGLQLDPVITNNGATIQLAPTIREMVADGLLGTFLRTALIGDAIRGKIQGAIMEAVDPKNLRVSVPSDLNKYYPRFSALRFADFGEGRLGVVSEASLDVPKDVLESLISALLH